MYIGRVYLPGSGSAARQTAFNKTKLGGSAMNQNNQKTKNTNKPRNTKSAQRKKATETVLPTVEEAKLSLPPHLELLPSDTDEMPTLIDREHYGTTLKVKHGHVYTLRLGVHCYSGEIGRASCRERV